MHKPFMVAPERLVVPCISDGCLPPSFVNEVHVIAPQLFLQRFIKSLDSRRAQVDFWGKACFSPMDPPVARLGVVRFPPQYAQKFLSPPCAMFPQVVVGAGLEPSEDLCICSLSLSIASGVCHRCKA